MQSVGLDTAIPASERPQTYALDRWASDKLNTLIIKVTVSRVQTDGTNYKKVLSQKLHSVNIVGFTVTEYLNIYSFMNVLNNEVLRDMRLYQRFSYRRSAGQYYFRNYGN
jgi:hypothetical protein